MAHQSIKQIDEARTRITFPIILFAGPALKGKQMALEMGRDACTVRTYANEEVRVGDFINTHVARSSGRLSKCSYA
jgi:hypothetical protein